MPREAHGPRVKWSRFDAIEGVRAWGRDLDV